MQRPQRIRTKNEYGNMQSLPEGKQYFQPLGGDGPPLLLGLGPRPQEICRLFPDAEIIYYMECPEFEKQVPGFEALPAKVKKISPEQLQKQNRFRIFFYKPNRKLHPSFWEPILAKLILEKTAIGRQQRSRSVWLPGTENSLLLPELSRSFGSAGFTYRVIDPDAMRRDLLSLLDRELPEIVLSVNFNGLDSYGETYFMLREAGVKTVVWLVDNPFHIISGIRSAYWKQVPTMVTDHWFIPSLEKLGIENITHLPLATDPEIFNPEVPEYPGLEDRVVFVGRSSFPAKSTFFSGCTFTDKDYEEALQAIEKGSKPDFAWWASGYEKADFWPDREVRQIGFKAEQSGLLWRTTALQKAGEKLTLFGDAGWKDFFAQSDLRGSVDYFTVLPSIYAGAGITLNLTSPLLPCGLTQRNFDVWAAGGFLLTDRTDGLSIFPEELFEPCCFSSPEEIPALCARFSNSPEEREIISKKWRRHILEDHTYRNRVDNILNFIT